ncbi:MAG: preprotein translocase subunit SecG [Clostridia bacterium]|nr:preprotein translocase subunit SecG [Clostridia bacterium]
MSTLEYIIGGLLLILAVALVAVIGMQQSKRKSGLGNSIAGSGASETYLARNNIGNKTSIAKKLTVIFSIIFVVLVVMLYIVGSVDEAADTSSTTSGTSSTVSGTTSGTTSNTSGTTSNTSDATSNTSSQAVSDTSK